MIELKYPFILASGSPRRKEILETMGIPFTVDVSEMDETFVGAPQDAVVVISGRKAEAVAKRYADAYVLAADTLVFADHVMGKPGTQERAIEMLRELSGRWHSVFTGLTLIHPRSGNTIQRLCETRVHFIDMCDDEIRAYAATNDCNDKAGAYGIQSLGGVFVDEIIGSYSNVVGLPMSVVYDMIKEMNKKLRLGE